jgi:hypothetical protein
MQRPVTALLQYVFKSLSENLQNRDFSRFCTQPPYFPTMPPLPHTPRIPLCELSPNTRSRVVSAHDYDIRYRDIAEQENLSSSTCRSIFKNAPNQASCNSQPRSGRPSVITVRDGRRLFRAIAINPKITATQLRVEVMLEVLEITIY